MQLIFYKILQISIIILFGVLVSDLRKKNITKRLLNQKLLIIMKLSYLAPLIIFLVSVITNKKILITDVFALVITLIGLMVVADAKFNLGKNHSWTGYGTFPENFCTKGSFSLMQHPMYTGIIICIIGMVLHVSFHVSWPWLLLNLVSSLFIIYILISSAKKENEHLQELFGDDYKNYADQIHPFLPIRRYKARSILD